MRFGAGYAARRFGGTWRRSSPSTRHCPQAFDGPPLALLGRRGHERTERCKASDTQTPETPRHGAHSWPAQSAQSSDTASVSLRGGALRPCSSYGYPSSSSSLDHRKCRSKMRGGGICGLVLVFRFLSGFLYTGLYTSSKKKIVHGATQRADKADKISRVAGVLA
jgi:hypothetical protein